MTQLNDVVESVVDGFVNSGELFTALDVSNKVKLSLPFARHGEVRDVVRQLFTNKLQGQSWARSQINVTLPDGRQEVAMLYHPLSDSWDLDDKYDTQKRAQASFRPTAPVAAPVATTPVVAPTPVATPSAPVVPSVLTQSARDKWNNLFNSQPSLFPRK